MAEVLAEGCQARIFLRRHMHREVCPRKIRSVARPVWGIGRSWIWSSSVPAVAFQRKRQKGTEPSERGALLRIVRDTLRFIFKISEPGPSRRSRRTR